MNRHVFIVAMAVAALGGAAAAQQNRIDTVSPLAPELASYGKYDIGVRTLQVTDKRRPDILNTKEGAATVFYDRPITDNNQLFSYLRSLAPHSG